MGISEELKKKRNVYHIFLLIFSIIATGLIANLDCFDCKSDFFYENQFIDATIFGYLIIGILLFVIIFLQEELPPKTLSLVCLGGGALHLVTSVLFFLYLNDYYSDNKIFANRTTEKGRTIGALIVSFILGILYLVEMLINIIKPSLLD